MSQRTCSVPGCGPTDGRLARGLCNVHYLRAYTSGTLPPLPPRPTPLDRFNEKWVLGPNPTSDPTLGPCHIWTSGTNGRYGVFWDGERRTYAHEFAWRQENGELPESHELDHRCHTPPCVRASHLRAVTHKQNQENRLPTKANTSGVVGVTWDRRTQSWAAKVTHNRRTYHAGRHSTIEEAAEAVRQLRLRLFTHNDMDRRKAPAPR